MINTSGWILGLRLHLRLKQGPFAKRLGVSQPTASRWEQGSEPKVSHWDALKALAHDSGYPQPDSRPKPMVPLIGFVGAGTELNLFGNGQGPFDEHEMPPNGSDKTVAVEVRGDSMHGWADDKWILYYDNVQNPPTENLMGKLCVVGLSDDRTLTKKLMPGRRPGHFDLWSSNAAPMLDQEVIWAAKVLWIKPT